MTTTAAATAASERFLPQLRTWAVGIASVAAAAGSVLVPMELATISSVTVFVAEVEVPDLPTDTIGIVLAGIAVLLLAVYWWRVGVEHRELTATRRSEQQAVHEEEVAETEDIVGFTVGPGEVDPPAEPAPARPRPLAYRLPAVVLVGGLLAAAVVAIA